MDTTHLREKQEIIAAEVHNAWWREKEKQGFHAPMDCACPIETGQDATFSKRCESCHTDMYPYEDLPENVKEYDRVTVNAVLDAIEKI